MIHVGNLAPAMMCDSCVATYLANPVGDPVSHPAWDKWDDQVVTPVYDVTGVTDVALDACAGCGTRVLGTRTEVRIRLTVQAVPSTFASTDARQVEVRNGKVLVVAAAAAVSDRE